MFVYTAILPGCRRLCEFVCGTTGQRDNGTTVYYGARNMDDLNDKEDGFRLITMPEYTLQDVRKYLEPTGVADKFDFLPQVENLAEVCRKLRQLLDSQPYSLDEMATIFAAASMMYFVDVAAENFECRTYVLHMPFEYVDSMNPMHIHIIAKRIWNALKTDSMAFILNIISLCNQMTVAGDTGKAVGLCLMWAVLCEITEFDMPMFRFREFSEMIDMLSELDAEMVLLPDNTHVLYMLLQAVSYILNIAMGEGTKCLESTGYGNYLRYKKRDLKMLKDWTESLSAALKVSVTKTQNFWNLRMTIKEFLNANIVAILEDKLGEYDSAKVVKSIQ